MIIYLHGLNSSVLSEKAQVMLEYCGHAGIPCVAPTLSPAPVKAVEQIGALVSKAGAHTLVGSSMGGYYATWFCQQFPALRAVLINPAVALAEKLSDYVGQEQVNYHTGERYIFTEAYRSQLAVLSVSTITKPERYLLMVTTGDEVLDYQEAVNFYQGARQIVEAGGDHSFACFADYLPTITEFASASSSAK